MTPKLCRPIFRGGAYHAPWRQVMASHETERTHEEGLRRHAHPLIRFVDGPTGRRASLIGRGLDVWEVIAIVGDNNGSVRAVAPAPVAAGGR